MSPEEEIPIFLVLSSYEQTKCSGGPALFSPFSPREDGTRHFLRQEMPGDCVQLILIKGVLTLPGTVLKCMLHLLTSKPLYSPVFKMGTVLIHISEDSIHLENSRARTGTQVTWLLSPCS